MSQFRPPPIFNTYFPQSLLNFFYCICYETFLPTTQNPKLYWPYDPDSKNNTSCIRMPTGIDDLNSQDYVTILGIYIPS